MNNPLIYFKQVIDQLLSGDARIIFDQTFLSILNDNINHLVNLDVNNYTDYDIELVGYLLHIGNIVYNNIPLDDDQQPIDNGVYDILLEKYRKYRVPQVGAEPIQFKYLPNLNYANNLEAKPLVTILDNRDLLYEEDMLDDTITLDRLSSPLVEFMGFQTGMKYRNISHNNPTLVGTLDKCKYVLNSQAVEKGVFDDPSVKVLERDFFEPHFRKGIINNYQILRMILEFKYDGVSVVVTVRNGIVVAAVSRGDTGMDEATDLTPILYGYRFPKCPNFDIDLDIKCEAVMTHYDLQLFSKDRNYNYANCRAAIIALFRLNDAYLYRNYITLVPLAVAATNAEDELESMTRLEEINFLNKYFTTKERLRYSYIEGTYDRIMFMIKKFVDEAEFIRPIMPTMYDGVVLSYADDDIRQILGRENFTNKYSVAIKFNTMKKLTKLIAIKFTVGQNGVITPMAYYQPVEFFGTIHTKSSISSVSRFNENKFKIGNIVEIEYRNDVMPYLTTPLLDYNTDNPNPVLEFINVCPECGTALEFTKKSAKCPNINCKGRTIARMSNMFDKLGLKDFAESSMEKINKSSFTEILQTTREEIEPIIGPINAYKFIQRIEEIKTKPMYDFQIVGSLGFTDIAQETWKKIFNHMTISVLLTLYDSNELASNLVSIKGIGPSTCDTIMQELPYYRNDLITILGMRNIKPSIGLKQISIRVTGFRDPELMQRLVDMGYDASDKGVTKDTNILLIPSSNHQSSKLNKIGPNTIVLVKDDFINNMDYYLRNISMS